MKEVAKAKPEEEKKEEPQEEKEEAPAENGEAKAEEVSWRLHVWVAVWNLHRGDVRGAPKMITHVFSLLQPAAAAEEADEKEDEAEEEEKAAE